MYRVARGYLGQVYNPENGKDYAADLELDGDVLKVRGACGSDSLVEPEMDEDSQLSLVISSSPQVMQKQTGYFRCLDEVPVSFGG